MLTSEVKNITGGITRFSEEEFNLVEPFFELVALKINEILLTEGQLCNAIFLVLSGMLRNYYNNNGLDINLSFTLENQFTTSFEAYINREPSKIIIQALEKSVVWTIHTRKISKASKPFTTFSTFIRRLAIRILFATEEHHNR